jgi:DNA-binding SARP family transcriptional activator/ABC-type transport system substrate-binding protein/streptogramin lyase
VEITLQRCFAEPVEFAVLGPVEVRIEGEAAPLGGPKQRALLALLLLNGNAVVSRDRLIDGLWGERPPSSAQRSLDTYVSRLRAVVGNERIERRTPGYLLHVEPGELDLDRFEALLEEGRAASAAGDAAAARDRLREALALWRGRALADLEYEPFAGTETARLEERRLLAIEAQLAAELDLGGGPDLVGQLEQLVTEHPFRERLLGQLMLALYRAGRKADALAAYQACRRRFAEELGLEPSAELRELERRILEQDAALGAPPRSRALRSPAIKRRRTLAAAVALVAVAVSAAIGLELGIGGSRASSTGESRTGVFELAGHSSLAGAALDDAPAAMALDAKSIWLAEPNSGQVVEVDRATREVVDRVPVGGNPSALVVGGGSVWAASVPGETIYRIAPATGDITQRIDLGARRVAALAFGLGRLWVADGTREELLAYDPHTGRRFRTIRIDVHPTALVVGPENIWITDYDDGLLAEIDPRSGAGLGTVHVGDGPIAVAVGDDAVWVADNLDDTVRRVDPLSETPGAAIEVGSYPVSLAVDGRFVDVANEYSSSVSRIDSRSNAVHTTKIAGGPTALASGGGRIWVGTRALGVHRGGTLVLLHTRPLPQDTALQLDLNPLQSNGLTYDALLGHARIGGDFRLVPDLALRVPEAADGGTTYTFRLRKGIHYWDGRLVRPEDFRRAIERLFRLGSGWSANYTSIVGTSNCSAIACDLRRGIVVDDAARTITFRLTQPDPGFRPSMTSIGTAPVPPGVPFHYLGYKAMPGTGPYEVASADSHHIRYVRNPHFVEWSHVAQPDGNPDVIVMRYGLSPAQEVREVESGKADWTADSVPGNLFAEVKTRFPGQWRSLGDTATDFFQINTMIPPFNDIRVRKALNFAIDRAAIARMNGGQELATPTCQTVPPGLPGYRRYCPYTLRPTADGRWHAPDLAEARRLIAASGTRGDLVTVVGASDGGVLGTTVVRYMARLLDRLGYDAQTLIPPFSSYRSLPWSNFQMHSADADCACPNFESWFTCSAPFNNRWICDPQVDREVAHGKAVAATNSRAAVAIVAKLDREVVDKAYWIPLDNPHFIDFFSKKVRYYQADPSLGLIADQVWLR